MRAKPASIFASSRAWLNSVYEVLLTVDQNLSFQQNLRASGVGGVVAVARTNRVKELRPLVPQILEALAAVKPGELLTVVG